MKIYLAPTIVLSQKAANGAERHDKRVTVEIAKLAQQADPSIPAAVGGHGMLHGARHSDPFATTPPGAFLDRLGSYEVRGDRLILTPGR